MSTLKRELAITEIERLNEEDLNGMMVEAFEKLTGPLVPGKKDDVLIAKMKALEERMINDGWLFQKGRRRKDRVVKVRSGLEVFQRVHKAPGGLCQDFWS